MSVRSSWFLVLIKSSVSMLICLVLVIMESGVLKSQQLLLNHLFHLSILSILPYVSWGYLGAYIFILIYGFLIDWPFYQLKCPSLSLLTVFVFNYILPGIRIASPALFWFLFIWRIFFILFNFIVSLI